jgi:DNA-binding transcriptional LysR family regulator
MSTSAVSRLVMELEAWLGVQLFNRTTRRVGLTEAGRVYLERCTRIVDEVAELERSAKALSHDPRGEVRVTAPPYVGKHFLAPILPDFLARYPDVKIRLHLLDRFVDLVDEGFDLALRIAALPDSTLIARRLGGTALLLTAAPRYLARHGKPETVEDLRHHNCLVDSVASQGGRWPLLGRTGARSLAVNGNLTINNGEMVRDMTLAGVGISLLPDFFVSREIAEGRLIDLLPGAVAVDAGIYAVYPPTRHLASSVRVLLDFLVAHTERLDGLR